jgi:hypothetical protein
MTISVHVFRVLMVCGQSNHVRYRPVRVPRSWWCASQWKLLVGVKSLLRQAGFLIGWHVYHRMPNTAQHEATIPVEVLVVQGWWPHVEPCLASCYKHGIQSGSRPDAASSTPTNSSHWLAHHHERGTRAGLHLTWTDSPDISVPQRQGQRWSLKHWFFCHLTNWHGWEPGNILLYNVAMKATSHTNLNTYIWHLPLCLLHVVLYYCCCCYHSIFIFWYYVLSFKFCQILLSSISFSSISSVLVMISSYFFQQDCFPQLSVVVGKQTNLKFFLSFFFFIWEI